MLIKLNNNNFDQVIVNQIKNFKEIQSYQPVQLNSRSQLLYLEVTKTSRWKVFYDVEASVNDAMWKKTVVKTVLISIFTFGLFLLSRKGREQLHICKTHRFNALFACEEKNQKFIEKIEEEINKHTLMKDPDFASLIEKANKNDKESQYELGKMFINGEKGLKSNFSEGEKWLKKAFEQGHDHASIILGCAFDKQEKYAEAMECFTAAAEKGNGAGYFNLGIYHTEGKGTKKDDVVAFNHFKKAMDLENLHGKFCVATAYLNGKGVPQDKDKAKLLIKELIEADYRRAKYVKIE